MKALRLNDFVLMKSQKFSLIFAFVIALLEDYVIVQDNGVVGTFLLAVLGLGIIGVQPIVQFSMNNQYRGFLSLPVTRKRFVLHRYQLISSLILAGFVLNMAMKLVMVSVFHQEFNVPGFIFGHAGLLLFAMIWFSIFLPLMFHEGKVLPMISILFGIILMGFSMGILLVLFLFSSDNRTGISFDWLSPLKLSMLSSGCIVFAGILWFCSYKVSRKFFSQREFD